MIPLITSSDSSADFENNNTTAALSRIAFGIARTYDSPGMMLSGAIQQVTPGRSRRAQTAWASAKSSDA